jgi:hypothetical protein
LAILGDFLNSDLIVKYGLYLCVFLIASILINENKKTLLRGLEKLRKYSPFWANYFEECLNFPLVSHGPWVRVLACLLLILVLTALR